MPRFRQTTLPNGLTVMTERQPGYQGLAIGAWVRIGTRHEHPREAGVSHFLEHMLFKGTPSRSALDIARAVDRVGGEFNAFTAREHTCYHLFLLNRDLKLALDILSDVVLNTSFQPTELERERRVILQEIAMVDESPEELVHDAFFESCFGDHPLGRPILGTQRSIRRLKRSEILRYFRTHYSPRQTILAVSGDVSHASVLKNLGALRAKRWPGRPKTARPTAGQAKPAFKPGTRWIVRPTEQVHLVWGVPGPSYRSKDRLAAYLLNIHLGGGMSSSLFQEIREKNALAYTVYSMMSPFEDTGTFSIYAATAPAQVALCLSLVEKCVEKLKKEPLSKLELQVIKDNLKGSILLSADSVESRMASIAKNEIFLGRYVSPEEVCKEIDAITAEQLQRLARKLLGNEGTPKRCLTLLGPRPDRKLKAQLARLGFKL